MNMKCPKCGETSYMSKSKPIGNYKVGFIYEDSKGHKFGYSRNLNVNEKYDIGELTAILGAIKTK